ncbi:hypothetical protein COEREDRAFT_15973 [Coemansia reversa NRRL 1564]|uniref:DUF8032 domain-containing protein n=1 Tax=Coemansia reversa (strain ATCC 12441 / NRRL 1564) TaxID=763665 RepID=A0A2G5B9K8_COERN|nr:hypothetical protein COEREDRAFT_15973 [Coemansia reversa NRRL 1564]|eukprot:PIA15698.1 hypothetical protein COEREDRAFT_15973 [Coemansia reversa NRRL 1564]
MRAQFKAGTTTAAAAGSRTTAGSRGSSENSLGDRSEQVEEDSTKVVDGDSAFAELWAADQLDMGLLANLFGTHNSSNTIETMQGDVATEATTVATPSVEGVEAEEHNVYGIGAITTEALRSLDAFEQQGAVHTEGKELGQLDSAEISAALEQLCWGSLDIPSGISTEAEATPCGGTETDVEAETEPVGNPMELEELSLFSLFLADMKPFEAFLESLSLHQLRQCAATVNSVLVRREGDIDPRRPSNAAAATVATGPVQTSGSATGLVESSEVATGPAFSLLREWLPASTADSVIAALQTAHLDAGGSAPASAGASRASSSNVLVPGSSGGAETEEQANEPRVETGSDGTPWLSFVYAQKGKTRRHQIRIDMERATLGAIPSSFRTNNCVYPRANCTRQAYGGNRWGYETECNALGWRLAFLNQELLASRRGLLQAAVNSYRAAVAGRKSRRIARLEKATPAKRPATAKAAGSTAEKRARTALPSPVTAQGAKSLAVPLSAGGRMRISVEVGALEAAEVDETFRREHAVFPRALSAEQSRYGAQLGRWAFEVVCNELAWRLAWLNCSRLRGRRLLIQLCLDAYRERFSAPPWPLLECYRTLMAGDVEPEFFDYWSPRNKRRQRAPPATEPHKLGSALPVSTLATTVSTLPTSTLSDEASVARAHKPAACPEASSSAQSAPASVPQTLANKSRPTSARATGGMPASLRPRTPITTRPIAIEKSVSTGVANVRNVRPHPPPTVASDGRPRPPVQRPKNIAQTNRPLRPPANPSTFAQQRTGTLPLSAPSRPSSASAPRPQLLKRALRPPAPAQSRPTTPTAVRPAITPAPASPQPRSEDRAAKAQVAADMLADVLHRLAGTDPSLAGLLAAQSGATSGAGPRKPPLRLEDNVTQDDGVLLDAKVAELEKLITELQRN